MNQEPAWTSDHWRFSSAVAASNPHHANSSPLPPQQSHQHYEPGHRQYEPSRPQLGVPQALNSTSQGAVVRDDRNNNDRPSAAIPRELPRLTEPVAAPAYHGRPFEPRHETSAGSWRSLQDDRCTSSSHGPDTPQLTLHIPHQPSELPRLPTALPSEARGASSYHTDTSTNSLPSFATFQKRSKVANDDVDGPEIAPMSSRLSCDTCITLKPLLQQTALAFGEIDEIVQACCNRPGQRAIDVPKDGPISVAQWIVDRLPRIRADLYAFNQQSQQRHQQHARTLGLSSGRQSPRNQLKRSGEQWEREDLLASKRPRSDASTEVPFQLPAYTSREERRASVDFAYGREPHQGYSPPPTESVPGSAYPRQTSPTLTNRLNLRALPSPTSFPSAAPSLPPPTVASVGSPATSYQPTVSIHTASTNSATSAHIADLQHQVTLKSLALQTLQTEYASLLQKLQRERVKSQTIEKKTSVADQEVNDLTGKNEDLSERVRELETALDDSERKREAERLETARDKEQWGRMLEMNGRLYAKVDSARQKLSDEKAVLEQQVASLEGRGDRGSSKLGVGPVSQDRDQDRPPVLSGNPSKSQDPLQRVGVLGATAPGSASNSEDAGLRREVDFLKERIDSLRSTLEGARLHNQGLESRLRGILEHNTHWNTSVDRALIEDDSKAKNQHKDTSVVGFPSNRSTPCPQKSSWNSPGIPSAATSRSTTFPASRNHSITDRAPAGTLEVIRDGKTSTAIIAEVARARSPGPEELGFHVAPSTSSPEELIRALGPVPAPIPTMQPGQHYWQSATKYHEMKPSHQVSFWRSGAPDGRPAGTSPRSYHSSPGEAVDDGRSSSGYSERSPEAYISDPEPTTATKAEAFSPRDQQGHFRAMSSRTWMPPPPPPIGSTSRT